MVLFFDIEERKDKRFFMMHTSATVPPYGPAGTSRAFPHDSQEPLWDKSMRPLRLPDPCPLAQTPGVVCKVSGSPVFGYASHWVWGPRCSATRTSRGYSRRALLALGLRWPSCIPCPRPILQNCRHHENQNLSHHRHCSTVRNFSNFHGHQQLHEPAKPHRHKQRPINHLHGKGPCKFIFLLSLYRHTHLSRGLPFAQLPLGSPHPCSPCCSCVVVYPHLIFFFLNRNTHFIAFVSHLLKSVQSGTTPAPVFAPKAKYVVRNVPPSFSKFYSKSIS